MFAEGGMHTQILFWGNACLDLVLETSHACQEAESEVMNSRGSRISLVFPLGEWGTQKKSCVTVLMGEQKRGRSGDTRAALALTDTLPRFL